MFWMPKRRKGGKLSGLFLLTLLGVTYVLEVFDGQEI